MIVPPGVPEFDDPFGIDPGHEVDFPFTKRPSLNVDVIAFKCDSLSSFLAYWEFS